MIGRLITTLLLLFLAFYAFWGNALGAGRINPFGFLFLLLAAIVWWNWETIKEAFRVVRGESDMPIIRLSARVIDGIGGLLRKEQPRRSSSN